MYNLDVVSARALAIIPVHTIRCSLEVRVTSSAPLCSLWFPTIPYIDKRVYHHRSIPADIVRFVFVCC